MLNMCKRLSTREKERGGGREKERDLIMEYNIKQQ